MSANVNDLQSAFLAALVDGQRCLKVAMSRHSHPAWPDVERSATLRKRPTDRSCRRKARRPSIGSPAPLHTPGHSTIPPQVDARE